ncbi:hypothetical protein Fmac_023531 [Flemingia macrophylla]|uniref:Alpha-D-phosphohexomutase alpha/beta/alpha domain-containing protein n=1 Tax=Flemingia macrophylla TaxID=520843 RepID=A0ABD1LLZ1_9FABA
MVVTLIGKLRRSTFFNVQIIIKIAAGNGVGKILANGGFIMSASHNPGGPEYDWGIKFNYSSGQPAPESITDKVYGNTLSISHIKIADIPDVDLSNVGVTKFGSFIVEVIDPVSDYLELLEHHPKRSCFMADNRIKKSGDIVIKYGPINGSSDSKCFHPCYKGTEDTTSKDNSSPHSSSSRNGRIMTAWTIPPPCLCPQPSSMPTAYPSRR